ncbi:MAG TPA: flagellar type III secretion system pore protein FliP [bacterium]|jgi:flagellar biosynthetic protein FliP|nr:flagellar type III secretion system pore protein FliP [bacterium]
MRPRLSFAAVASGLFLLLALASRLAAATPLPDLHISVGSSTSPQQVSLTLQIVFLMTVLSLAPAILMLTTSFTRIIIVLSFLRQAIGTPTIPPNQVILGLALFLTFFNMNPVFSKVNDTALQPYLKGQLSQQAALTKALDPIRDFMFRQTREKDLALFVYLSKSPRPASPADVPTLVLIPAFVTSELKTAFQMGFLIYIPFLIIDMVVASTLMSMGMLMLPPVTISLPFKILLFVLIDGWHLIVRSLMLSFH